MPQPEPSILKSTKKLLGLAEDYDVFDMDLITHINSALDALTQIGVGPAEGFMIVDEFAEWGDFLGEDPRSWNGAKSYVAQKTRLAFDPPGTSFHIEALNKQLEETAWRLSVAYDSANREVEV